MGWLGVVESFLLTDGSDLFRGGAFSSVSPLTLSIIIEGDWFVPRCDSSILL